MINTETDNNKYHCLLVKLIRDLDLYLTGEADNKTLHDLRKLVDDKLNHDKFTKHEWS